MIGYLLFREFVKVVLVEAVTTRDVTGGGPEFQAVYKGVVDVHF